MQALDGRTGDLIWENRVRPGGQRGGGTGATRNIAIYQDKLFVATTDAHMLALDARTGKMIWETVFANNLTGAGTSSGPIVIGGKVLQGMSGCDFYKPEKEQGCFITAFDADEEVIWRFNTTPRAGEPGGDTWGDLPNMLRAGGETWITGSYDPDLNLTFWGVSQAKPWMLARSRGTKLAIKALYTTPRSRSHPEDGKLDLVLPTCRPVKRFDLDEVYERVLVDVGSRKLRLPSVSPASSGKLDPYGQFLDAKQTVFQNVFTHIDSKTGELNLSAATLWSRKRSGVSLLACPARKAAITGKP